MDEEKAFYIWVGQRLKVLREKAGLKQKVVAERIHVQPAFLSEVENKGKKLSAFQIKRVLEAMGYSPATLYNEEEKKEQISIEITGLDPETLQRMKENKEFWEKIKQSLQILFSLEAYEETVEKAEEEKKQ